MSMFPGPGAQIYRNEAGEPIGWDYPSEPEENYDPDDYLPADDPEMCSFCDENEATHFSAEWDAMLCDECEEAERKDAEEIAKKFKLSGKTPLEYFFKEE